MKKKSKNKKQEKEKDVLFLEGFFMGYAFDKLLKDFGLKKW